MVNYNAVLSINNGLVSVNFRQVSPNAATCHRLSAFRLSDVHYSCVCFIPLVVVAIILYNARRECSRSVIRRHKMPR